MRLRVHEGRVLHHAVFCASRRRQSCACARVCFKRVCFGDRPAASGPAARGGAHTRAGGRFAPASDFRPSTRGRWTPRPDRRLPSRCIRSALIVNRAPQPSPPCGFGRSWPPRDGPLCEGLRGSPGRGRRSSATYSMASDQVLLMCGSAGARDTTGQLLPGQLRRSSVFCWIIRERVGGPTEDRLPPRRPRSKRWKQVRGPPVPASWCTRLSQAEPGIAEKDGPRGRCDGRRRPHVARAILMARGGAAALASSASGWSSERGPRRGRSAGSPLPRSSS